MSLEERLEAIVAQHDAKTQAAAFQALFEELLAQQAVAPMQQVITRLLADEVPQQTTRPVLTAIAKAIKGAQSNGEIFSTMATFCIQQIRMHAVKFDEADYILRDALFNYYLETQQFKDAATTLVGVNMESVTKTFTDAEKADIYVKCAEAYLQEEESDQADVCVNKASMFMHAVEDSKLMLRYKFTYARVMDANRKFVDAAMRYHELSTGTSSETPQNELLELLGMAVTCAVLGKAGPPRSRVLGLLYKDERLHHLDHMPKYSSHSSVLTKMYTEQLLRRDELATFEGSLQAHQKAQGSDGFSIPEKAVIEHNMLATGKIYDNIHFGELGQILRLDAATAEKVAARMITEGRLLASIDQTASLLLFEADADALLSWDERIKELCDDVA